MTDNWDSVGRPGVGRGPHRQGLPPALMGEASGPLHICAFLDGRDEELQVLGPFYRQTFHQRRRSLHIVPPDRLQEHGACLAELGLDAHVCADCSQTFDRVALMGADIAGCDGAGRFDRHRLLDTFERLDAAAGEAPGDELHVVTQLGELLQDPEARGELMDHEAALNEWLRESRRSVVCLYDVATLDGATMMDLLRTHPLTLIGGVLRDNPFYTPPVEMLREFAARRGAGLDPQLRALR